MKANFFTKYWGKKISKALSKRLKNLLMLMGDSLVKVPKWNGMLVTVDIYKAFDSFNYEFVTFALKRY